ncbi:peptidoglycan-associated lipoprotein Pal [Aquabacterium sp.]|uniref:peptidoglycan-associated lipoprotein Pal n=1 Tax=Aquabacterium sp. TaxID=1872578 RepID=UPI002B513CE9|nr:peptidoglycan-associated lipoprotein Pal [Aquabacterium sp.]HSW04637.1 peptidoglycan-associated lipoprotein Pal [Aquabacterium sp.]
MKIIPSRLLVVAAVALLGACSSTPEATQAPVATATPTPTTTPPVATPSTAQPQPVATSPVRPVVLAAHLDPNNSIASNRSVFFEFDDDAIKQSDMSLIERHAKYLSTNQALAIKIEGNTDERGSTEYNLALGQRRAQSVLRALKIYGVPETRMEAVSWGEERPRAAGHDESAWAQNRRADLAYPSR